MAHHMAASDHATNNKVLNGDSGIDTDSSLVTNTSKQDSASAENGCRESESGDVNSIFLCEFHAREGPKITMQVPNEYVTKDLFRIIHQYIIPKVPLQGSFLSM